jgi:hypothetical protein
MSAVDVVLQVFRSVEERNPQLAAEVYHDDRGRDRAGRWLDTPVLGLYQVRDGKLARA